MTIEENIKFESYSKQGYEFRRYKFECEEECFIKYLFYKEKNPGKGDFVLVYAGFDEEAWKNIEWLKNDN